jgi:DNA-binding IclR family transcriptional regulator
VDTSGTESIRSYELLNVNQALDLIDALIVARDGLSLSQLSRSFGLSKNKIFRILSTLEQRGMVEKDGNSLYRLGISAFGTARRILSRESVLDQARPVMVELATVLNEAVYLATMIGSEAMFQEMADCHHPIKTKSFIGSRFPFPCAAEAGCGAWQFDVAGMRIYVNELKDEATTVSAPLLDGSGRTVGALVVLAPSFRMPLARIRSEILLPVSTAAQLLSRKLGTSAGQHPPARSQAQPANFPVKPPVIVAAQSSIFRQNGRQCHH